MELDHICDARACVNPRHLEPVSHQTHCYRAAKRRRAIEEFTTVRQVMADITGKADKSWHGAVIGGAQE